MNIGTKIRIIRKLREMTQRDLGLALGISENNAAKRIYQYEKNEKIPKDDVIDKMIEIFQISPYALLKKIDNPTIELIQQIFWFEETLNLSPQANQSVKINSNISCEPTLSRNIHSSLYLHSDKVFTTSSGEGDLTYCALSMKEYFLNMVNTEHMYRKNYLAWKLGWPYNLPMHEYYKMYHMQGFGNEPSETDLNYFKQLTKLDKKLKSENVFVKINYEIPIMYDEQNRIHLLEKFREELK